MNQNNLNDFSPKKKKPLKQKIDVNYKSKQWLKLSGWNRFSYLTLTAFILTVVITFISPAWLPIEQSVTYGALPRETNDRLIFAQEESPQLREENQELQEQIEEPAIEEESPSEEPTTEEELAPSEEPAIEEEAPSEEPAIEEESPSEEPAIEEESPSEEPAIEEESPSEEPAIEEESPSEEPAIEEESPSEEPAIEEESAPSEEELPFEEAKKSLEEEIDERYEEWESEKTSSEISHSISAIATILTTIFIALLGTGILHIPYNRTVILVLGIITVFIQLNINVFLLDKTLAGYEILAEQGLSFKDKLESVETEEQLQEVREQFQELVLESLILE
ncbi:conserved membrane hypothetical protein [Hyella patelloides LEGE 07179]|uniref:Uncharacterized protein n=1 Tax=Hyella patelloides LEGE 07179 TaxID=945734 RepID=A0A563VY70_9CYAN|nr:hypothetical protein [Hyella patelloides]VEP16360.1 conserved membrane hypothetical protein [Hyella patelloides LEGE 07179]